MKAAPLRKQHPERDKRGAMARARRIPAAASLTAGCDIASRPVSVDRSFKAQLGNGPKQEMQ